ncbi:restriction endonuclease subunit S [Pseudonocardia sp. RS11V-5]|uniref:restriction endonuclease subunit S n=1 Tax=Pseudonocardia terrae TaxID=2905831 RepID=UPI001E361CCE|nr:restriction endonuclease subunit S [Pseudonocardia terrae]MCE3552422.1 restriction endonuclease subunit S [Pseudonocardia terrae]
MSKIERLIAELCPSGVEFRALGDVGQFVRGGGLQKKDFVAEGFPCIHYGQIYTYYGSSASTTKSFVEPALAAMLKKAATGDLVVTTTSENVEDVCTAVAWLGEGEIAIGGHSCVFKHTLDPMYVAYCFQTEQFELQKRKFVTGTKVKEIKVADIGRIRIPVPPITIQREIASALGVMEQLKTELQAQLEVELGCRSRQYSYYRDQLFMFRDAEAAQWVPLGDVAINHDSRRRPVTKAAREPGEIPYYGASGIVDYVSDFIFDGDYLLVSEDGANLLARSTPIAFTASGKTWINNHAHVLELATYAERRFLEFYLNSIDLTPYISGAAQPKLNKANLSRIPVPQPPLEEQKRIVGILDKLEALVNNLRIGLSAEIDLRRRQYEYYRDRLLIFKEAA